MSANIVNGFDFGALPIAVSLVGKVTADEWEHYLWDVTFTYKGGFWKTQYKTGIGLVSNKGKFNERPTKPKNSDVMHAILSDMSADEMSFRNWCGDYGYSDDSISALKTYNACCEIAVHVRKVFTREQIDAMRVALEDY